MTWMEDVIFGMAPLGILTAMVGAIRVGGPKWMKAAVGRAQEAKGIVEMELMSSTSTDVCEVWDGQRVIRMLGSPAVAQLFYFVPDDAHTAVDSQPIGQVNEEAHPLQPLKNGTGVGEGTQRNGRERRSRQESERGGRQRGMEVRSEPSNTSGHPTGIPTVS